MRRLFPSDRTTLGFQHGYDASGPKRKSLSGFLLKSTQAANFLGSARIFPAYAVSKRQTRSETSFPVIFMPKRRSGGSAQETTTPWHLLHTIRRWRSPARGSRCGSTKLRYPTVEQLSIWRLEK